MRRRWIYIVPMAILGMALFIFVGGEVVKLLWNWLLPSLFGWRQIRFWEAVGLLALCRILFGGFGGHRSIRGNVRRRMQERMAERWERMSPEERERFRQGMRGGCGMNTPASS